MGVTGAVPATRTGRPRRFESEDELRILLDAALVVMDRNGYVDAAVADVLREADLSTRSFYRHFQSKDQLLCALFRREADAAATRLRAKVDGASTPVEALHAWIDEILNFGHHRVKAARLSVLGSPGAMRAAGYGEEVRHAIGGLDRPPGSLVAPGCGRRLAPAGRPGRGRAAHPIGGLGCGGPQCRHGQADLADTKRRAGCSPSASVPRG